MTTVEPVSRERSTILNIVWLMIFAITIIDVSVAFVLQNTILAWEQNPVQHWVIAKFGIGAAIAFRLASIVFCYNVIERLSRRWQYAWSFTVLAVHIHLLNLYLESMKKLVDQWIEHC